MPDPISSLFSLNGFMPHGYCLNWSPWLLWTMVLSDGLIFAAYMSLPVALAYFARHRGDFPYARVLWLFVAFILACGFTHLIGAVVLWKPAYWLEALFKAITAGVSVLTAVVLWPLMPHLLRLPNPVELREANERLRLEIAERMRAEEALSEAKAVLECGLAAERMRMAAIVESSGDAVIGKTLDGIISSWNPAAERIFGHAAGEAVGQPFLMLVPPELAEAETENMRRVAHGEGIQNVEATLLHGSGRRIEISETISPIKDGRGEVVGLSRIVRDITESKRAAAALRESEERLRLALKAANQGMFDLNLKTGESRVNDEYALMLGYDPSGFRETNIDWIERMHPDDRDAVARAYLGYIEGQTFEYRVEFRQRTRSGGWKWILSLGSLIERDAEGRPLRMLGTHTDITERKQIEEAQAFLLKCGLPSTGEDFFQSLARYLAENLGMEYVCIDRLEGEGMYAQTVAIYHDGKFDPDVRYALKDTPCGAVINETVCCYPRDVRGLFPNDPALDDLSAESYVGTLLLDSKGCPVGLIAVIGRRPLAEPRRATALLNLVAPRAAGELERREAERSLRISEERLNLAMLATNDVVWDWDIVNNLQCWNSAGARVFGWTEIVEHSQSADWWLDRVHPEDRRRVAEGFWGAVNDPAVNHWEDEYRFLRADGGYAPVHDRGHVLRDGTGRALRMIGAMLDISERKRTEAELEQHRHHLEELVRRRTAELMASEARASQILESSADGLFGVDRNGKAVFINPAACQMLGYAPDQVLGRPLHALIHHSRPDGSPYPEIECPALACLRAGLVSRVDNEVYWHADGHPIPVMYAIHPFFRDGEVTGAVVSFVDMSARLATERAREQALAAAESLARARQQFLANMSHEIRTPLNGVLGFAQIGRSCCGDPPKARNAFDKILESGQLLLGVINDILDFSKIEHGSFAVESIPVNLVGTLREAADLVRQKALAKGLEFDIAMDSSLPGLCLSDPLRLKQIFANLLSNAVKFTASGKVALAASRRGDQLVFEISDTGIGMDESQLGRLFNPFEQADGSTTRKFGGTGLGLAITQRLVAALGGGIRVESRPGSGSTFEVRLPYWPVTAAMATPSAASAEERKIEGSRPLADISILVAEDNEINQCVIEENLRDLGARVVLVDNGRDAVERVREDGADAYDLVLMDIQMPVMDGYEATRLILEFAPGLPVIGQTAHAYGEEKERCFDVGMVAHIAKPIAPKELLETILRHAKRTNEKA